MNLIKKVVLSKKCKDVLFQSVEKAKGIWQTPKYRKLIIYGAGCTASICIVLSWKKVVLAAPIIIDALPEVAEKVSFLRRVKKRAYEIYSSKKNRRSVAKHLLNASILLLALRLQAFAIHSATDAILNENQEHLELMSMALYACRKNGNDNFL